MPNRNEIRSQQDHNKSLLRSNKPRFKENIRENIYKDEIPEDGLLFDRIPEKSVEQVIKKIRSNARLETIKDFKLLIISILIILFLIFLFVHKVEEEMHRRNNVTHPTNLYRT
ncbi:hypothetical protein [Christiangramia sp.]|uniref:hypothetical protein n=1 Tax=Christiangramia sp. TaxID=1931228 RepID=UPI002612F6C9|nr:hypothetical protein [Christiangramia sp.]